MADDVLAANDSLQTSSTLSSITALARFEFESGKGNEGTKVMMVEWHDADHARRKSGQWQVSWPGKRTAFPADDRRVDDIHRVYFLLPPDATVPPQVTLAFHPRPTTAGAEPEPPLLSQTVNPLPAIFTPELGASATVSGRKGVLHTIWAKKRLQGLEREIAQEKEHNLEGIALEMAVAEREWIENTFGLVAKPPALDLSNVPASAPSPPLLQSPKSPNSRRLSEKLKGLSLQTQATADDATGSAGEFSALQAHPLSPEESDMAFSSFATFGTTPAKQVVAQRPPASLQERQDTLALASIDAVTRRPSEPTDDLFAVALSPRSPNGPKSPFSMSRAEVGVFAKIKGEK